MGLVVDTFDEISITVCPRWIFNCYLIHDGGSGKPVVVDAGLPGLVDDLLPVLASLRIATTTDLRASSPRTATAATSAASHRWQLSQAPRAFPLICDYLAGETPRSPSLRAIARVWPTLLDQPFDREGALGAAHGLRTAGYGSSGPMRWPRRPPPGFLIDGEHLPAPPAAASSRHARPPTTASRSGSQHRRSCCLAAQCCRSMGSRGSLRNRRRQART